MALMNDVVIRCSKCGKTHIVNKDYFECSESWDDGEREMGHEVYYSFDYEFNCECRNNISIQIEAWEYPVGMFNFENPYIKGGKFLINPTCDVIHEFFDYEDYDFEEIEDSTEILINKIKNMSPREFEECVADFYREQGFEVFLTKQTRDGGYDIVCTKNIPSKIVILVECKHYNSDNKVDVSIVRELFGVKVSNKANQAVLITTSSFTKDAIEFAESQSTELELVDFNRFLSWLENE